MYQHTCPNCGGRKHPVAAETLPAGFSDKIDVETQRLIKQIFESGKPDNEILRLTGSLLAGRVTKGYGKITTDYTTPDVEMLARLTRDVWQFSAAKDYRQMRDLTLALKDESGKMREFADFKELAGTICDKYNKTWLRTEYDSAVAASQNAARWADFTKEAKNIPNLEYQTAGDDHVRDEHAALDGIVRPLKDAFWDTHYPPNGWGCRCEAIQSLAGKGEITKEKDIPYVPIPPLFRTNLAKTGLIYPKNHPYYDGVPRAEIRKAIAWMPPENTYQSLVIGNSEIDVHPLHGEKELAKNLDACNALLNIDKKAKIKLLPVINQHDNAIKNKFYPKEYLKKYPDKNGDILYNGVVCEIESPNGSKKSIQHAVGYGMAQAGKVIIHIPENIDIEFAFKVVNGHVLAHYSEKKPDIWLLNSKELRQYKKQKRQKPK